MRPARLMAFAFLALTTAPALAEVSGCGRPASLEDGLQLAPTLLTASRTRAAHATASPSFPGSTTAALMLINIATPREIVREAQMCLRPSSLPCATRP